MKYRLSLLLVMVPFLSFSQFYHDTQGKLEISESGQSTYTLPVAMPPTLRNVGPVINLVYASGQLGGIAGQGWGITSISNIARIGTRLDIDGFIDGVDYDENDKLALDGQRLLLKTGSYWGAGSTYQTEVHSNYRVELQGTGASMYFIVTSADGSRSWYGNYGGADASDLTSFYITRFEDTSGNFITYHYARPQGKSLCISEIKFSGNAGGLAAINSIAFNYKQAARTESAFVKGVKHERVVTLDEILVRTNNQLFRKYKITHIVDPQLGYERVSKIQEFNGAGEPANPVTFEYDTTSMESYGSEQYFNYTSNLDITQVDASGDFDGDGRMDFLANNTLFTKMFQSNGNSYATPTLLSVNGLGAKKYAVTTLTNNKLNQFQSIASLVVSDNSVDVKVHNFHNGVAELNFVKTIAINNMNTCYSECPGSQCMETPRNYPNMLEGDFNGDGISEFLVISDYEHTTYTIVPNSNEPVLPLVPGTKSGETEKPDPITIPGGMICKKEISKIQARECFILDMNPNSSTAVGSRGYAMISQNKFWIQGSNRYVADFNGDGKSDVLVMTGNSYRLVGFKQLSSAPWVEMELLGAGTLDKYSATKQILFGDFNGDGKVDIMLPDTEGGQNESQWSIYYSNPKPSGGEFFLKETHNIVEYRPNSGTGYSTQTHLSNYYAMDTNGDGKSDVVRVWRKHYKADWTFNNYDHEWHISTFVNNIGNTQAGSSFAMDYVSPGNHDNSTSHLPIPIVSTYRHKGIDCEIIMYQNKADGTMAINFSKDVSKDVLLRKVTSSGGAIQDEIFYKNLESTLMHPGGFASFYSWENGEIYPNVELATLPGVKAVERIVNTHGGLAREQNFRYSGYIVNLGGLGTIGFRKTARSSWKDVGANDMNAWSVSDNNPQWRGAPRKKYMQLVQGNLFTFSPSTVYTPVNAISMTVNDFSTASAGGVFSLLLDKETFTDILTGNVVETSYAYDPQFLLPGTIVKKNKGGGNVTGTTTVTTTFDSNPSGAGNSYYIGRPTKTETVLEAYGDVHTSSSEYSYANKRLVKTKKKGNLSESKYIVEDAEYDTYGNVTKKTLSSEGYGGLVIAPRVTEYTYDATGRFVVSTTDVEGMVTTNSEFDPLYGLVKTSTNPFMQTSTTEYDSWGKIRKQTDFLGKSILTAYAKTSGEYTTTQNGEDGSSNIAVSDYLGRLIRTGKKNIDNAWTFKSVEYDKMGRKYKESEPYLGGTQPLWNITEYDHYGRTVKSTSPSGLVTNISYDGNTVTANDGIKTTSSTKNANGHVIKATDGGGTIFYSHYADGSVRLTNYDGNIITMGYDEFGRKKYMTDPAAGNYLYSYYPTGELRSETTPKGVTTYSVDGAGKLIGKTIVGDNINQVHTYFYDLVTKQLFLHDFYDEDNGSGQAVEYYYDSSKRVKRTLEHNVEHFYEKEFYYDNFGRVFKEKITAVHNPTNKSSSRELMYTFKNGYNWQIVDTATGIVVWQPNSVTAKGQLEGGILGNGIAITNTYDIYGFPLQSVHQKSGANAGNVMTLTTAFEPQRGNLLSRSSNLFNVSESFQYDNMDRLTHYSDALGQTLEQHYDATGRITENSIGTYEYGNINKKYQNTSVNLSQSAFSYYSNRQGIFSDGMECKAGWLQPSNGAISYDSNNKKTGDYSLKITNTNNTESVSHADRWVSVDNSQPTQYTYSAWVYSDAPTSQLFLFMKTQGETGAYTYVDDVISTAVGSWTYVEKTVMVPADIKKLNIRLDNNGYGSVWFDDVNIRKTDGVTPLRQLKISYNGVKNPVEIEEPGVDRISFVENADNGRSAMYYGGMQADMAQRAYRKYYSNSGDVEIKYNTVTQQVEILTYVGGNGYSAPAVLRSDGTKQSYLYIHRDYQGSILAVTDQAANIIEKRMFDAWGMLLKVQDGQGNNLSGMTVLDRGYTGHEHLQSVGLVHMNGRLYDSGLHRFLQPDNFVQEPYNTQNYNRYCYVLNNPLKFTDPSGEEFISFTAAVIIGAVVAASTYTFTALTSAAPFTGMGLLKNTVIGAISAAVTYGVGSLATNGIQQLGTRMVFQTLAHGTFQGMVSGVQGGNFWSGFASGAISSMVSSVWAGGKMANKSIWKGIGGTWGSGDIGTVAFGTISGGAGAALTGGNFWQGAATGFTVSLLNHFVHSDDFVAKKDSEIIVLNDAEAVGGVGHMAMIAGNDQKGWTYVASGGRAETDGNTILGGDSIPILETKYTNPQLASKESALNYLSRFESKASLKVTYRNAMKAVNAAYKSANGYYHVLIHNCGHVIRDGLESINVYGGGKYTISPNMRFIEMMNGRPIFR